MNTSRTQGRVAVIGAGLSGSQCAHKLAAQGWRVDLFDKSRGTGGRLSTRRMGWTDAQGQAQLAELDHGAPALTAASRDFASWLDHAEQEGRVRAWSPRTGHLAAFAPGKQWLPVPDMPALCRQLGQGIQLHLNQNVDALSHQGGHWRLGSQGNTGSEAFDAVVLAMPAPQAAALLAPHQAPWAQQAQAVSMAPCWTLMGVSDALAQAPQWEAGRPRSGALAWASRNECKPGRQAPADRMHWVAQASAAWTQAHLQDTPESVQATLQEALHQLLGQPLTWQHATVHRWLYASVQDHAVADAPCWWDAQSGLGVCGDFFAPTDASGQVVHGAQGAERAWLSAQALASSVSTSLGTGTQP